MTATVDHPTKKSAFPKEQATDPVLDQKNWAKNEDTVKKFLVRSRQFFSDFRGQTAWAVMMTDLKKSDELTRMSEIQTKGDANKTGDEVDTIPDEYHRAMRTITANENDAMWHRDDPPVKFIPKETASEAEQMEAKQLADKWNGVLEHDNIMDERAEKMKDAQYFLNKNGNQIDTLEWVTEKVQTKKRVVLKRDPETGQPTKMGWKTVPETKCYTRWTTSGMEDWYLDTTIDDMQKQQCVGRDFRPTQSQLVAKVNAGEYVNLKMIGKGQLAMATGSDGETIRADRQTNAGEGDDKADPSGLYLGRNVWLRAPINDKGEWDEKGTWASWHLATFIGNYDSEPVCVQLIPNPYSDKEIPHKLVHSHRDEKGAIHMWYRHILGPKYDELKNTYDQWYDAKNLMVNAPWKGGWGALTNRDKTFGPKRYFIMAPGRFQELERVKVDMNTADMLPMIQDQRLQFREAAGITKTFEGEGLGARATASESRSALEQSLKPFVSKLRYNSERYKWMAAKSQRMWKQFAPKECVIVVMRGDVGEEIKPAELWGDFYTKVVAVDEYEKNTVIRLEQDKLLQLSLPFLAQAGNAKKINALLKEVYKDREVLSPESMQVVFGNVGEADAAKNAHSENRGFMDGVMDDPQPDEDHEIHDAVHANFETLYRLAPEAPPEPLQLVQAHRALHKQMKAAATQQLQQQGAQAQQQQNVSESPPQTFGQAAGDLLGAEEGGYQ